MEWDRLQVDLQYTLEMPKPTFVKVTFSHILQLPSMITWGVGAIPFNVHAKLERNKDFTIIIQAI